MVKRKAAGGATAGYCSNLLTCLQGILFMFFELKVVF